MASCVSDGIECSNHSESSYPFHGGVFSWYCTGERTNRCDSYCRITQHYSQTPIIMPFQVFFQNNPLSGLMILIAMFVQSSRVAVHGIIAIIVGNLTGLLMGFDKSFFSCGLFGYNSFLVGLAIATFDSSNLHTGYNMSAVIGVIIASYLSSVLFIMLGKLLAPYKVR